MVALAIVVHSGPEILGETPVFVGTRVPARILLEHIEGDQTLARLLDDFSPVPREPAVGLLERAKQLVSSGAPS